LDGRRGVFRVHRLRLRFRELSRDDRVDQPVFERARRVKVEVGALGVLDDLAQRFARSRRQDLVDLILHLFESLQMLRRGRRRLPAGPFRRFVNHDPGMREGEPLAVAGRLQDDRAHRIRHPLHDDLHFDAALDDVANGVVNGEAVGDIPAGAVDEDGDRPVVLVGELTEPFDAAPCRILLDVADEINIPQPVRCFLAELRADGIDELRDQTIAQLSHRLHYRIESRRSLQESRRTGVFTKVTS
jgi:hypothetical protein